MSSLITKMQIFQPKSETLRPRVLINVQILARDGISGTALEATNLMASVTIGLMHGRLALNLTSKNLPKN